MGGSNAWWPFEGSKLCGQWKVPSLVTLGKFKALWLMEVALKKFQALWSMEGFKLGGPWKILMFGGPWKILMLGGP